MKYNGTSYAGFQIQQNACTIQSEVERVFQILFKQQIKLTGASRTDAGVHAHQNFFQFDFDQQLTSRISYNLNALLPMDIAVVSLRQVHNNSHARFDALSREYHYFVYSVKDPFLFQKAWYYPYKLNIGAMQEAAAMLINYNDFTSFSKRNTQAFTNNCTLIKSEWSEGENELIYKVKANRFLRGMVRGLVGTMIQVGRGTIDLHQFREIIEAKDCTKADFSTPAHGLFLHAIEYPATVFE